MTAEQGREISAGTGVKAGTGTRLLRFVSQVQRPDKEGKYEWMSQISFSDRAISNVSLDPGIQMRLSANICHLLVTKNNITLSICSGILRKDCLQLETNPDPVLIKIMGRAGPRNDTILRLVVMMNRYRPAPQGCAALNWAGLR